MANESLMGSDIPKSRSQVHAEKVSMVVDGVGAGQDMRSTGNPLSAVLIRSSLIFGHNVLLGRYFNVDSNKPSNKK